MKRNVVNILVIIQKSYYFLKQFKKSQKTIFPEERLVCYLDGKNGGFLWV